MIEARKGSPAEIKKMSAALKVDIKQRKLMCWMSTHAILRYHVVKVQFLKIFARYLHNIMNDLTI